jgi:hypothetical protein
MSVNGPVVRIISTRLRTYNNNSSTAYFIPKSPIILKSGMNELIQWHHWNCSLTPVLFHMRFSLMLNRCWRVVHNATDCIGLNN